MTVLLKPLLYMRPVVRLLAAAGLTIPMLIIWAERDYVVTSRSLSGALPQAETQIMRGGHMFTEQYSQEAFQRSMAFLAGM